jgi:hypothetical protein
MIFSELSKAILKAGPDVRRQVVQRAIAYKTGIVYFHNGKPKKISYKKLMAK